MDVELESEVGRCCHSTLVIPPSSLGPYRFHTREGGKREVEVVELEDDDPSTASARSLLLTSGSSNSLLKNNLHQERRIACLEKENSDLKKANNGLKSKIKGLKDKNKDLNEEVNELVQKVLKLERKLVASNISVEQDPSANENEQGPGLTYDELQRMNTVKEAAYQTGQESDALSVDEMTGQEPTLAELQSMNSVRD